jgi:cysteine synthase A
MPISPDILASIGKTPLVELRAPSSSGSGRVLAKLEGLNPTGSMKDRMARAMIEAAEADGSLQPGGRVVEFTGGSTGTSLAMVCASRGYQLSIVTSNVASLEKRNHMKALGASLTVLQSDGANMTNELYKALVSTTEEITRETGAFWTDQFHNPAQVEGYRALGEEIWEQTGGHVDAFVQVVGTCGSFRGVTATLRGFNSALYAVAVEPAESPVLSGGVPGPHRIEGVGIGQVPHLWEDHLADAIEQVSTAEAEETARLLARQEGIFVGTSSGANLAAALRVAQRLGPKATVATIMVDTGLKYLSTDLFQ